jgi:protein arginine kinase
MKFNALFRSQPEWMTAEGPHSDIALTSRVRFARNLELHPFPGWARREVCLLVLAELQPKVEALPEMNPAFSMRLSSMEQMERQILVEKHLVSKEHAARNEGCAVVINSAQTLSIMINEEDHLRMQSILPGLNLRQALAMLDRVDTELESLAQYAYHKDLGYLTSCPTNLGTGMRASAMLHLPGLVISEQINKVIHGVNKLNLAVRGLYGEGTEALGNLFQISNQHTLGESELGLTAKLETVIQKMIGYERDARHKLAEDEPQKVMNQVGRAYGALRHAYLLDSKEALNHISMLRMGADLGLFPAGTARALDAILVDIQPAHLQYRSQSKLNAEERDACRAEYLREQLANLPGPTQL